MSMLERLNIELPVFSDAWAVAQRWLTYEPPTPAMPAKLSEKPRISRTDRHWPMDWHRRWRCTGCWVTAYGETPFDAYQAWRQVHRDMANTTVA